MHSPAQRRPRTGPLHNSDLGLVRYTTATSNWSTIQQRPRTGPLHNGDLERLYYPTATSNWSTTRRRRQTGPLHDIKQQVCQSSVHLADELKLQVLYVWCSTDNSITVLDNALDEWASSFLMRMCKLWTHERLVYWH